MIKNKVNEKCYIGQTNNIERRIRRHKKDSKILDTYLYRSIRKYGWDNFDISIIDECDSREELNEREIFYIDKYDSFNNGYNMTLGGDGHNGLSPSEETRKKISEANSKIKKDEEWCRKISESRKKNYIKENHPNYGKHLSEETKIKIGNGNRGKIRNKEFKKKIREYLSSEDNKRRNMYMIVSPEGEVTETKFLKDYCKDHNLVYSCMTRVGRGERKHHKGYKVKIKRIS